MNYSKDTMTKSEMINYLNAEGRRITDELGYGFEELEFGQCPDYLLNALLDSISSTGMLKEFGEEA